jgi:hypothetical protein
LYVWQADAIRERFAEGRQGPGRLRIFYVERPLLTFIREWAAHVANEMHDNVTMGDVDIEFVERVAAEILEIPAPSPRRCVA